MKNKIKPDKQYEIKNMILSIKDDDLCNDTYGRKRMHEALIYKFRDKKVPSERTIYRILKEMGIKHIKKKGPKGITKADKNAKKSEDLFKRNFSADRPYEKLVTDITEISVLNKKLYVSAIFDCYSLKVLGISIKDNMKTDLVLETLENAYITHPMIRGAILHSDRGSVYTSYEYREQLKYYGIIQSMNSDGGRCHDNARCESMWARMKKELLYNRYQTINMNFDNVKQLIWRYYMSYWNNRRICSAIGGIPPVDKEKQYYDLINKNNNDIA